jgi:predicted amidohydrolase
MADVAPRDRLRVAACQMTATENKDHNRDVAERLVRAAHADGAEYVLLPEMWNVMGHADTLDAGAEPLDGPTDAWAAALAGSLGIWFHAGSITERVDEASKHCNTSCLYSPEGTRVAVYRKIHLFDNELPGAAYHESATVTPGDTIVTAAVADVTLGLSICFDIRFPELFRILALRGADLIGLPMAFMLMTGKDHMEPLARAHAITNQVFMVVADQLGGVGPDLQFRGRSMIIDPWGIVLAQAPDTETHIVADLDLKAQRSMRAALPALADRRPSTYRWPDTADQQR